ncbi:MAG: amidohydrolase family protein [Conexivisphaerales archaeon]
MMLAIKNARLPSADGIFNIHIEDGFVKRISRSDITADYTIDAKGGLVTESFAVAHLHLDKVNTLQLLDDKTVTAYRDDPRDAIKMASKVKKYYNEDDIVKRVKPFLDQSIKFGVTHIRAFLDVDTMAKLTAVKAMKKLKGEYEGRIELQLVAFPQEGLLDDPQLVDYLYSALENGADVVGGIPWLESTVEMQRKHITTVFEIAKRYNKDVAMLVDDAPDPSLRTLEMLAEETIKNRWKGRVQACHARASALYPSDALEKTLKICKEAMIGIAGNPHTGGEVHAPLKVFSEYGITVALGQDDCQDAYYPYGRCKMTEVAFLASHILRMMTHQEMMKLLQWITINPASMMGVGYHALKQGAAADLLLFREKSWYEVLIHQSDPMLVLHNGDTLYESLQA